MADVQTSAQPAAPKSSSPSNGEPRKASDPRRVLACGTCRKRKLKCDSKRPKCSTCARLGHPCEYDEVRKKSGPKRGYVKELEARLKQVETLLTSQGDDRSPPQPAPLEQQQQSFPATSGGMNMFNTSSMNADSMVGIGQDADMIDPNLNLNEAYGMGGIEDFNWDMISLGLEEPLPPQDVMDELYNTYFEKVHPSMPMIHRPRFMASLNMPMNQRPPVCLRYIMWAHACGMLPQYKTSAEQFYQKARKYIEQDQMKGHGESFISVPHAQAFILIATYEFKAMYFPRAWMTCGDGTRISQLMGLHRQDRVGLDVKQTMAPPKDWIEREERRRTFWMAYCNDRYASIGTGWPMSIDERDILTNLPASEEAFLTGKAEPAPALQDVMAGEGTSGLSSFAGVCLLATLFGRNLTHLHRPADDDNDHDLNGGFWKRHRSIDNILLNTSLSLPAHLRLPYGLNDPNIVFANMNIHTSAICLHQAAIFKADKHRLAPQISAESKRRCIVAADQITNIMKMCSHQDLSHLNPFIAFCLYVAARVFVQYLKSKKEDATVAASLTFLLSAMMALRNKNPLTESFLVQLDVDLEGSGLNIPSPLGPNRYVNRPAAECPANTDAVRCTAIYELRETQSLGYQARGVEPINSGQLDTNVDFGSMGYNPMTHHHPAQGAAHPPFKGVPIGASPGSSGQNGYDHAFGNAIQGKSPTGDGQSTGSSHSNQPTPSASSSSHHTSSHTSFSPPNDSDIDNMQPFYASQVPKDNSGVEQGPFVPGIIPSQPRSGNSSNTQYSILNPLKSNQNSNNEQNGFGNVFGGTGFTPDPSGYTPGPTGFTPGPSGFTPGPTGMTPGNWNDMQMPENGEWMYGDWRTGDTPGQQT
ncbi:hypothetical protein PMZ80_001328 [Knufia obscura]|uniref:Zn(2)-C6 fungal-type domain-containing protein n=2 Tax=Knufia TaxID=430999 RepID=A0AAN8I7Q7_9EURO|nr:hypothetical protein PMZ80_001328 [Knufia obscura]KAK5956269.1 hypothetical protein OHC33_002845 [Knufia fluminis]